MSTNDKLESLENIAECARTNKGEKRKFFQCLEEYKDSEGPLTKKLLALRKSWISLVGGRKSIV